MPPESFASPAAPVQTIVLRPISKSQFSNETFRQACCGTLFPTTLWQKCPHRGTSARAKFVFCAFRHIRQLLVTLMCRQNDKQAATQQHHPVMCPHESLPLLPSTVSKSPPHLAPLTRTRRCVAYVSVSVSVVHSPNAAHHHKCDRSANKSPAFRASSSSMPEVGRTCNRDTPLSHESNLLWCNTSPKRPYSDSCHGLVRRCYQGYFFVTITVAEPELSLTAS